MSSKILILEDDSDFASMLLETLTANELEAEVRLDPDEALLYLQEENVDLLVTDFMMPKLEGTAFIRKLRKFNTTIPVIMISAYMGNQDIIRAAEAGVTRVLRKPFESAELIREIHQLLQASPEKAKPGRGRKSTSLGLSDEFDYPQPLQYLPDGGHSSGAWIQALWEEFQKQGPIFVVGEPGFELDLIVAEMCAWCKCPGTVSLDFEASDLQNTRTRSTIAKLVGTDDCSPVVVVRNLDRLPRNQQKSFAQVIQKDSKYFPRAENLRFLCPIEGEKFSLAELAFEDDLLELVYANQVRVPPLRGRYSDIAHHVVIEGMNEDASRMHFSPMAIRRLLLSEWPGNYRQLCEVIQRLKLLRGGSVIQEPDLLAVMEKRMDHAAEDALPPSLLHVLLAEQQRIVEAVGSEFKIGHKAALEKLKVAPEDIPDADILGKNLIYSDLLKSAAR